MKDRSDRRHRHTCQGVVDLLCDLLEGDLPDQEEQELKRHMGDCPPCLSFLNTYRKTTEICRSIRPEEIPPELREKLESFLHASRRRQDDPAG
jgi:anti-sigma factor (TIGR02949 family)